MRVPDRRRKQTCLLLKEDGQMFQQKDKYSVMGNVTEKDAQICDKGNQQIINFENLGSHALMLSTVLVSTY